MTIEKSLLRVWSCCSWLFSVVWRVFVHQNFLEKNCWLLSCNHEDLQTLLNYWRLKSIAHQSNSDDLGMRIQQTKLLHILIFFTLILKGQTPPSTGTARRTSDWKSSGYLARFIMCGFCDFCLRTENSPDWPKNLCSGFSNSLNILFFNQQQWRWKQSLKLDIFFPVAPPTLLRPLFHGFDSCPMVLTSPEKKTPLISPLVSAPSSVLLLKRCCLSDQSPSQCHLRCGVLIDHEIIQKAPQPASCSLKVSSDSSSKVHPSVW